MTSYKRRKDNKMRTNQFFDSVNADNAKNMYQYEEIKENDLLFKNSLRKLIFGPSHKNSFTLLQEIMEMIKAI